jgi:hypothetical protein
MSNANTSKLGNLSQAESEIAEKHGPDEKKDNRKEAAPDDKDSKQEQSDMQSEGGN